MLTLESLSARVDALEKQAAIGLSADVGADQLLKSAGFSSPQQGDEDGLSSTPEPPSPGPNPLCPACGASVHPRIDDATPNQETNSIMERLSVLEMAVLALQSNRRMPMEYARRDPVPAVGWMQSFSATRQSPERVPERGSDPVVCSTGSMPIRG